MDHRKEVQYLLPDITGKWGEKKTLHFQLLCLIMLCVRKCFRNTATLFISSREKVERENDVKIQNCLLCFKFSNSVVSPILAYFPI